jgi:hypothetical protein
LEKSALVSAKALSLLAAALRWFWSGFRQPQNQRIAASGVARLLHAPSVQITTASQDEYLGEINQENV